MSVIEGCESIRFKVLGNDSKKKQLELLLPFVTFKCYRIVPESVVEHDGNISSPIWWIFTVIACSKKYTDRDSIYAGPNFGGLNRVWTGIFSSINGVICASSKKSLPPIKRISVPRRSMASFLASKNYFCSRSSFLVLAGFEYIVP